MPLAVGRWPRSRGGENGGQRRADPGQAGRGEPVARSRGSEAPTRLAHAVADAPRGEGRPASHAAALRKRPRARPMILAPLPRALLAYQGQSERLSRDARDRALEPRCDLNERQTWVRVLRPEVCQFLGRPSPLQSLRHSVHPRPLPRIILCIGRAWDRRSFGGGREGRAPWLVQSILFLVWAIGRVESWFEPPPRRACSP